MVHLTPEEASVLRQTLGLSYYNRENPRRNHLYQDDADKVASVVSGLIQRGYLSHAYTFGPTGRIPFYKATDAGRFAVLEQKWPTPA